MNRRSGLFPSDRGSFLGRKQNYPGGDSYQIIFLARSRARKRERGYDYRSFNNEWIPRSRAMSLRGQKRPSCIVASSETRRKSGERLDRLDRPYWLRYSGSVGHKAPGPLGRTEFSPHRNPSACERRGVSHEIFGPVPL